MNFPILNVCLIYFPQIFPFIWPMAAQELRQRAGEQPQAGHAPHRGGVSQTSPTRVDFWGFLGIFKGKLLISKGKSQSKMDDPPNVSPLIVLERNQVFLDIPSGKHTKKAWKNHPFE